MPLDNCSTEIQMKKRFAQKICRYAVKCHEWLKKNESIVWEANDSSITLQKLRQSNLKCQATNKPTSSAKCHQVFLFFKWLESVMVLCIQCTLEYMFCNVSERRVLLIVQWTTIVYWIIIGKMRDVHLTAFRLAIGKLFHHRDDFAMRIFFIRLLLPLPLMQSNWN